MVVLTGDVRSGPDVLWKNSFRAYGLFGFLYSSKIEADLICFSFFFIIRFIHQAAQGQIWSRPIQIAFFFEMRRSQRDFRGMCMLEKKVRHITKSLLFKSWILATEEERSWKCLKNSIDKYKPASSFWGFVKSLCSLPKSSNGTQGLSFRALSWCSLVTATQRAASITYQQLASLC